MRSAKRDERGAGRDKQGAADRVIVTAALILVTLAVFFQVRHFGFVNWDDPSYLTENANVQAGLSWANVAWAMTTTHSPYWHPMTWLSHMLDVTLFGMDAGWHHVTSLVIHIGSTLLLFAVLRRTTRDVGKSAFVAAVFAVHPLHVESVAWLAERKDVLSTFFLMLTIWMYVRYVERPGAGRYAMIVIAYALALMSKPMVVTLPFVLLILDFWPLRRFGRPEGPRYEDENTARHHTGVAQAFRPGGAQTGVARAFRPATLVIEKLPLLAMAIGVGVATVIVQRQVGAVAGLDVLPLGARVTNAVVGYVMYAWKTIWPARLAAFYPFRTYPGWLVALAAAALAAATIFALRAWRKRPFVTVGWLWYLITLAPVVGLTQAGEQAMADRFMYVPMVGLLFIVAWGITMPGLNTRPTTKLPRSGVGRVFRPGVAMAVVLALAFTAHAQAAHWSDSVALWRHATAVIDKNYIGYENLAQALRERGQLDEAVANYREALKVAPMTSPGYEAMVHNSLGLTLQRAGRTDEAEEHFAKAVDLSPRFAEAQSNLGNAVAAQGRFDDAIRHFRAALALKPQLTEALIGLGGALVREGRAPEAEAEYRQALRLDASVAQAHNGLGSALTLQHRDDAAMAEFNRALELKPDLPSAHLNIAILLLRKNDVAGARRHLETALSIDPGYEPARNVLARIR